MTNYDVAVIGAGPGGYVTAIRCAQLGLKTICIDKWINTQNKASLGGTCLNVGCIPSKALLDSSHLYEACKEEAASHGIGMTPGKLDVPAMLARKNTIISQMSQGISGLFKKNKVDSLLGSATIVDKNTIEVTTDGNKEIVKAEKIVIATGSVPAQIPGATIEKSIVDNEGALDFEAVPGDLGIIGAGVIGLELGSVWRRLGANVTILEMVADFLPAVDREIAKEALKIFKSQGLDIKLGTKVTDIENDDDYVSVTYEDQSGEDELEFEKLIVAVGRKPLTENLGLETVGVELDDRGYIVVNKQCQTSVDNIYAIGDVTRGPMLAHRASKDGIVVAENIAGKNKSIDYQSIPWVIYTWPEIAWAGATEQELKDKSISYKKGKFPFLANGRAHAMNCAKGMIKILSSEDGTVLGVHIIGPNASELISEGVAAISKKLSYTDIIDEIHAHPTLTEAFHEAALDIENRTIHI
ncbi:MAG: dihydrolipoyl dehydrogenase [Gammaproteobacteria bacterium]